MFAGLKKYPAETQLLLVILIIAVVTTLSLSALRAWQGNMAIAAIDLYFCIGLCASIYYILRTAETRKASIFIMVIAYSAIIPIIYLSGAMEINWIFAIMAGSFFMLKPAEAICINTLAFALCIPHLLSLWTASDLLFFVLPIVLMNVYCFMFAKIIWMQKSQLIELAIKDPLTGTGNRRALAEGMEQLLGMRKRKEITASLIAFDIDSFKDINDVYGHQAGDRVLSTVTEIIHSRIRLTDNLYRQGGDEFVIVALDTDQDTAIRLAEELRRLIQNTIFDGGYRATLSFGVAELGKEETQEEWLRNVDKALYNAKLAGRNTVCTSDSSESAFYSLRNQSSH